MNFVRSIPRELRKAKEELPGIISKLRATYKERTHPKVLLIDNLIWICLLIMVSVFIYGKLFGTDPSESYYTALCCPLGLAALSCNFTSLIFNSVSTFENAEIHWRNERPSWRRREAGEFASLSWRIYICSGAALFILAQRDELNRDSIILTK